MGTARKGMPALPCRGAGKGRVELYIPIQRCGLLIGKGGSMFKELTAAFGVHLSVPRAGDPDGTPTTIEGNPEQVEACFHKVSDAVYSEVSVMHAINVNVAAAGAIEQPFHGAIPTPKRVMQPMPSMQQSKGCGRGVKGSVGNGSRSSIQEQIRILEQFDHPVLGPLGDALQLAEPSSAVFISVIPAQFDEYGLYVLFAPFGPVLQVTMSRENGFGEGVVRFIEPASAMTAAEHMNGIQLPGAPSPLVVQLEGSHENVLAEPQADEGHVRLELLVPVSRCGLLIGPGGQAFKDLQGKFGVKLQVPSRGDPEGSLTVVEGSIRGVEACVQKIQAMVKGECQIVSSP